MSKLTVKDLREALEGVPDDLEVVFNSDTVESAEVVLERFERITYDIIGLDNNRVTTDYFCIYGNYDYSYEEDEGY